MSISLPAASVLCTIVTANAARSHSFTVSENDTKIFETCIKKIGFSEEELADAIRNYDKDANENVKCFNGCLFKGFNIIKVDGTIDVNAAIKYYQVENVESDKKIVTECSKNAKGKNDCDTAHYVESCFHTLRH